MKIMILFLAVVLSVRVRAEVGEVVEKSLDSVVIVVVQQGDQASRGSGFWINGRVLTCEHVLNKQTTAIVVRPDGTINAVIVQKRDEELDLALLEPVEPKDLPPGLVLAEKVKFLEEVVQISSPGDLEFAVTIGRVMKIREGFTNFNLTTWFGSSGAPILNLKGEVVGVSAEIFPGTTITRSVSLERIRRFLDDQKPKDKGR